MDWIFGLQKAIDYIENNLTETIDYDTVAAQSFSSSYHFQRVFSILCGFTVGEYIRNRRLSLAGAELAAGNAKVIEIALKYGYESPDSFAKAFQKFHGILPSQAKNNGSNIKSFSRLVLKFSLEGGNVMQYRIEEREAITLLGHKALCIGSPTCADNTYNQTKTHWLSTRDIQHSLKELRKGNPVWYDIYSDFQNDTFSHSIAVETDSQMPKANLEAITISSHLYAIFETKHCESPDDEWLPLMKRIVSEWMPATEYVMSNHPQINKQYFSQDFSKRYMEIWIPIEKVK